MVSNLRSTLFILKTNEPNIEMKNLILVNTVILCVSNVLNIVALAAQTKFHPEGFVVEKNSEVEVATSNFESNENCASNNLDLVGTVERTETELNTGDILTHLDVSEGSKTVKNMSLDLLMANHDWTRRENRLKVIIVPHSHNDPGWGHTFLSYYEGKTKFILSLMLENLVKDPSLKFIWAEVSFFSHWYEELDAMDRKNVQKIIESGQLEFVNGGWVMPDEATTLYTSLTTQLIQGQIWLKQHLNYEPRNGWTIDPFGQSPVQAYLMERTGLHNLVVNRIHFAVRRFLAEKTQLQFKWRQDWDSNGSHDILCHVMAYGGYESGNTCGPNSTICDGAMESGGGGRANSLLSDYNDNANPPKEEITESDIHKKATALVDSYRRKALLYKKPTLMVALGSDFAWNAQLQWDHLTGVYKKIINHINSRPDLYNAEVRVGTLQNFFEAVNSDAAIQEKEAAMSSLIGDFFPYADNQFDYWTGFFTSRPFFKVMERELAAILRGAQIAFSIMWAEILDKNKKKFDHHQRMPQFLQNLMDKIVQSRKHLSLFQHHDAITGTSYTSVNEDNAKRLFEGLQNCVYVMQQSLYTLINLKDFSRTFENGQNESRLFLDPILTREGPKDLPKIRTISFPHDAENQQPIKVIVVFNSEAKSRVQLVKILVTTGLLVTNFVVTDSTGVEMQAELYPVFHKDGRSIEDSVFQLVFVATMGPLETKRFFVKKVNGSSSSSSVSHLVAQVKMRHVQSAPPGEGEGHKIFGKVQKEDNTTILKIFNSHMTLHFNPKSGLLQSTVVNGTEIPLQIKFLAYKNTKSGLYIFKPSGEAEPFFKEQAVQIIEVRGRLQSYVEIRRPRFGHRVTLYSYNGAGLESHAIHVHNWVDLSQEQENFELIMRLETGIKSQNLFYTDLNGFQMTQRRRLSTLPLEGNYYPVSTTMFIEDESHRLSILTGQPLGGSSLAPGQMELMLDRRLHQDDGKGLGWRQLDNVKTELEFKILLEIPSCPPPHRRHPILENKANLPMLSLEASLHLHFMLNPLYTFVQSNQHHQHQEMDLRDQGSDHRVVNSGSTPCDVQLVGLWPQSAPSRAPFDDGPSTDLLIPVLGMMVRRIGFDSRFHHHHEGHPQEMKSWPFSVRHIFGDLVLQSKNGVEETRLNFMKKINDSNGHVPVDHDFNLKLTRMEVSSFLIKIK